MRRYQGIIAIRLVISQIFHPIHWTSLGWFTEHNNKYCLGVVGGVVSHPTATTPNGRA